MNRDVFGVVVVEVVSVGVHGVVDAGPRGARVAAAEGHVVRLIRAIIPFSMQKTLDWLKKSIWNDGLPIVLNLKYKNRVNNSNSCR